MKEQPRTLVTHYRNSNFKHKMKKLQISQKIIYEKFTYTKTFYVHKIAAVNSSKIYFLKNAKKICKPSNRDLNRDWIKSVHKKNNFILTTHATLIWLLYYHNVCKLIYWFTFSWIFFFFTEKIFLFFSMSS